MNCNLPKESDLNLDDLGRRHLGRINEDMALYGEYLEVKYGYIERQISPEDQEDMYGVPVDRGDPRPNS
jgi:hypothetical protein